jgi:hypothetical protein
MFKNKRTFSDYQGSTSDRVVLGLTMPIATHGQLYTGLSRVEIASDIKIPWVSDRPLHSEWRLIEEACTLKASMLDCFANVRKNHAGLSHLTGY